MKNEWTVYRPIEPSKPEPEQPSEFLLGAEQYKPEAKAKAAVAR